MVEMSRTPRAVPTIWGSVPQRNKNFTGRTEILEQLRQGAPNRIAVVPGDPLPQALQGLGGVGKTAIVTEYAHRYRSEYDLVWWIPADEPALIPSSLAALALPLKLEPVAAVGIENAAAAVLDALRQGIPYSRWLLIFDNADQPEDLNDLIPQGPGDVLITSRNHRWQASVETVAIDVFTRSESTEFLAKRVPKSITDTDADQLADKLGDLPLALEQAGALQAETGMSVGEYIRQFDEHTADIMAEGKSPHYPESMTAVWRLSVATVRQQLPTALELLRCCAFFGPDPIPRDVFRRSTEVTHTRINDLVVNTTLLSRAIRELGRFALVRLEGRAISVHRLIQALLRDDLDSATQDEYRHEVHLILAAGAPRNPEDSKQWPLFADLIPHVASPVPQLASCRDRHVRAFALDVVRYLYRSGDLNSAKLFAERFARRWSEDSGPDDDTLLDMRRLLGNTLRELGEYSAAREIIESTMNDSDRVLGSRNPLTLALRNAWGADLRARGAFRQALEFDQTTLEIHREVYGEGNPQTWRVMSNLALDYGLNSDYPAARDLHQSVFTLQNDRSEEVSDMERVSSQSNLARDLRLCGDFLEARDVGQDACDLGQDLLGTEHYWTLRAMTDLSIALRRIDTEHEEALELAQQVYGMSVRLFGEENPDTLAAAINLSNMQRVMGRLDDALALAESTAALYPRVYGAKHPYSYGCSGNLALLYRLAGRPEEARQLNETALRGLDDTLTRDHFYSLTVAINLASDFAALGDAAAARALGEDTLRRLHSLIGQNHFLSLTCAANLTSDLRATSADDDANRLLAESLGRYASTLGEEHSEAKMADAGQRIDADFDPPPI